MNLLATKETVERRCTLSNTEFPRYPHHQISILPTLRRQSSQNTHGTTDELRLTRYILNVGLRHCQADITDPERAAELKKKRNFRSFYYRGIELDKLLDLPNEEFVELVTCRARRRFQRGLKRKPMGLIRKLRKAKKEAPPNEKPRMVKTHLRDMIVVPEMIGSVIGIYNGKVFNSVEIKPEMVGHYIGEFSITYKPVRHGRPGIGATHSSRFIPLK
ncbi:hypothetical protein M407DRAFT_30333 [Tulasnella calospora MUT 4182]|uniref:40S ribosomal protein S15 n=1 Tax=Tulasnella calospora MUT 4182 TaxID=1051891 RepID=A0A0C3PXY8_9AGAM|nr:hypothetical protein M407DRAFT_30333 [Tulasnella calospora MUT 4182]